MISNAIYYLLSNDPTVSGLVGTKIYPYMAQENIVYPYIIYEQIDLDPTDTKDGVSELDTSSFDIEIYTQTPSELTSIGLAVRNCLDRYSGIINGKRINSIKYISENSGFDIADRVHLRVQNYSVRYFPINTTLLQPTNLVAIANASDITLTWSDNATGETGYKIYRSTTLFNFSLLDTIAANSVSYVDSSVVVNTIYYYYVLPYDTIGNGLSSNIVSNKTSTPCADATVENSDQTYTDTVASGATLVLPDTTYNIYVNGNLDQSFAVPSISNQTINITP